MTKISNLGVVETLKGLNKKDFSSVEVTKEYLQLIENEKKLNAYIHFNTEKSLSLAELSDERRAKNEALPLDGLPIAVKDIFCVKGERTSACSKILENFIPNYESTVTSKLWQAGGVYIGKTSMDEFAMGSSNETSYFGSVVNPWSKEEEKLVPGGSSGGSASAVAARLAPIALGTDTGGSIRQPASFCGTVGMKPTYGRCSRWGIIAFASSLDQAGPLTRSVQDSALILQNMAGFDNLDSTSVDIKVPNFLDSCSRSIKGMKIGIPKEYKINELSSEVENIWNEGIRWLQDAGAEIVEVKLPHTKYALPTYYIVAPAEASANLARYDGVKYGYRKEDIKDLEQMYSQTRAEGFGEEVKRRILIGTYVLSAGYYDAYYLRAQKVRTKIVEDFNLAFKNCDAILTPTAPTGAFKVGEKNMDPVTMYMNDVFTVPASLAGLPAISIPSGLDSNGYPLGLQLIGKGFDEETLFSVGTILEKSANFKSI
ncbi:MAG: Glutamyl-tRNA(Gln) amidotransferase subunit A [Alphaproteobacteria bacterium MarineAlpha9_Bin3]|nr:MAG: Glutamyl-tRNA(Gln) amidotransferase subunit A [Alphaproteobacteria bacterium MarineAlpha9_Bin3]|tara:strand:- start:2884 stop:4338 length:1455 start_codon:yes stop_codon:yes gene_type:complete